MFPPPATWSTPSFSHCPVQRKEVAIAEFDAEEGLQAPRRKTVRRALGPTLGVEKTVGGGARGPEFINSSKYTRPENSGAIKLCGHTHLNMHIRTMCNVSTASIHTCRHIYPLHIQIRPMRRREGGKQLSEYEKIRNPNWENN